MNGFYKIARRFAILFSDFGSICMMALTILITANVVYRPFGAISGIYETVELTMVVIAVSSIVGAEAGNMHIVVDMLMAFFSEGLKGVLKKSGSILGIIYYGIMGYAALSIVPEKFSIHEVTDTVHIPIPPFRIIWGVGLIFFCILILAGITRKTDNQEVSDGYKS